MTALRTILLSLIAAWSVVVAPRAAEAFSGASDDAATPWLVVGFAIVAAVCGCLLLYVVYRRPGRVKTALDFPPMYDLPPERLAALTIGELEALVAGGAAANLRPPATGQPPAETLGRLQKEKADLRRFAANDSEAVAMVVKRWLNLPERAPEETAGGRRTVPGAKKAAALLMFLGEDLAIEVFRRLNEDEVRVAAGAIAGIDGVAPETMQAILDEFIRRLTREAHLAPAGGDFAANLVDQALDPAEARHVLRRLAFERQLERVRRSDPRAIAAVLQREHPQTIAFVLARLPPDAAAQVVAGLAPDLRAEVVRRVARLNEAAPGALEEVIEVLGRELAALAADPGEPAGGVAAVADILGDLPDETADAILEKLTKDEPELAAQMGRQRLAFTDLLRLEDADLRRVLAATAVGDAAAALSAADDATREKLLRCLPVHAAPIVAAEVERTGAASAADVKRAREAVVRNARRLARTGQIKF
jgi:flagellar motor switch protein FliG